MMLKITKIIKTLVIKKLINFDLQNISWLIKTKQQSNKLNNLKKNATMYYQFL